MEVSKISFSEETRQKLSNPMLDRKKRQELRRRLVLDYVKSKPVGTEFTTREFNELIFPQGHNHTNVLRFIKQMQRDKLIDVEAIPNTYKYRISVNDATTVVAPKYDKPKALWNDPVKEPEPAAETPVRVSAFDDIVELAKSFAWENNSDSLREFITWGKVKAFDEVQHRRKP